METEFRKECTFNSRNFQSTDKRGVLQAARDINYSNKGLRVRKFSLNFNS